MQCLSYESIAHREEFPARKLSDIVVVSIRRSHGQILFNPGGEAIIEGGDVLIAIGHAQSLMKLMAMAKGKVQSPMSKVQSH